MGIHKAVGPGHNAVDGNLLAGSHLQFIAHINRRYGHFLYLGFLDHLALCVNLSLFYHDMGCLWSQAHQLADA